MKFKNSLYAAQNMLLKKTGNKEQIQKTSSKNSKKVWMNMITWEYNSINLDVIYDHITEGIRIRSKCD